MYLGANELSIHGQFDRHQFLDLVDTLLRCRELVRSFGSALRCRRELLERPVVGEVPFRELLQQMPPQDVRKRLLLSWLSREGPFVEDDRLHSLDVYFECLSDVVTDSTVAELAHRQLHFPETAPAAVSARPSCMVMDPLTIDLHDDSGRVTPIALRNHTDASMLEAWLKLQERPMQSWADLETRALRECPSLYFARTAFTPLVAQPFFANAANNFLDLLRVLHRLKCCTLPSGRSPEGQEIYRQFFAKKNAWFTDSSDAEKVDFRGELTFPHPEKDGESLFCPWHGKVQTPQMRIHYSHEISAEKALYIVYVGPKLTKY